MMSALSSAVLMELQNFTVPPSDSPEINKNKRPFEDVDASSSDQNRQVVVKRQAIEESDSQTLVKKEKMVDNDEDVGYSLEDDNNDWSSTRTGAVDNKSISSAAPSTGNTIKPTTVPTMAAPAVKSNTNLAADRNELHTSTVELLSGTLSSSFYEPITSRTNNKLVSPLLPVESTEKVGCCLVISL